MALTQMQLIQSLGEAMAWFEKELSWDVPPQELRHLCGRIGELYAALITNGQMASGINQKGYDVVSGTGERISVKTTTMSNGSGHVTFNANTLNVVDRIMILKVNTEEMQIEVLLNEPVEVARILMSPSSDQRTLQIALSKLLARRQLQHDLCAVKEVTFQGILIRELESGTIELVRDGQQLSPVLPELKLMAEKLNISILNSNGNLFNTRQLGSLILRTLQAEQGELTARDQELVA